MGTTGKTRFAHRLTGAQTFESICLQCFRTVGRAEFEPGLERAEQLHVCLQEDVIQLHGKMQPETIRGEHHKKELA